MRTFALLLCALALPAEADTVIAARTIPALSMISRFF